MNEDLVKLTAIKCHAAARELNTLIDIYKVHCNDEEYKILIKEIADLNCSILVDFLDKRLREFPELEEKMDSIVRQYGVLF